MKWEVVSLSDRSRWADWVERAGCRDPYYSAAYHQAYSYDGGESWLFGAQSDGNVLVYPFRRHAITRVGAEPVAPGLSDLETVYGYGGPLANTEDAAFLTEAWAGLDAWLAEAQVVSEFCRFHPLLATQRFAHPAMARIHDRQVVSVDLGQGAEDLWAHYPSIQRNCVRKAQAAGLICRRLAYGDGIGIFRKIYGLTMDVLEAGAFYRFTPAYWQALGDLGEDVAVFVVEGLGGPVAASLFLTSGPIVHYHLSGSLPEHRALCPNNLMLHHAALWAMERGKTAMFLGGGRTNRPDDGLLRFKQSLARQSLPFFIGKRVCAPQSYEKLSRLWQEQAGVSQPPPMLQHYRLPIGKAFHHGS